MRRAGVMVCSLVLMASLARAQSTDSGSQQGLPPLSPVGPIKTIGDTVTPGDSSASGNPDVIADSRPLAGAQELTLGMPASVHNFLLPSFSVITQAGTNGFSSGSGSTSNAATSMTSFLSRRLGINR